MSLSPIHPLVLKSAAGGASQRTINGAPFSPREKVAGEARRMRANPHPRPLYRRRGER
jgi:hypothetical protein